MIETCLELVECGVGRDGRRRHVMGPRGLRDECLRTNVPFFFKQWGEWLPVRKLYQPDDEEEDGGNVDRQVCLSFGGHVYEDHDGQPDCPRTWVMERVGRVTAGRLLDGVEYSEFPQV